MGKKAVYFRIFIVVTAILGLFVLMASGMVSPAKVHKHKSHSKISKHFIYFDSLHSHELADNSLYIELASGGMFKDDILKEIFHPPC